MDIASFEDDLDRYGGDLAQWPAPARAAADEMLAASPAARALLAEMRDVEVVLRATRVQPGAGGVDRIAMRASDCRQETRARRMALRAGVGTAAAAVLALGILIGGLWPAPAARDLSPDRLLAAAIDTGGAGDVD